MGGRERMGGGNYLDQPAAIKCGSWVCDPAGFYRLNTFRFTAVLVG